MALNPEYREALVRIMSEYATLTPSVGDVEVEAVLDEARDHYEIIHAGWLGDRRIHGAILHVDIRGEKIWIQHDGTEDGIAGELLEAGVPKEQIVLAWHAPYERKLT